MQNIINVIKRDLPAILPVVGAIYAVLVQQGVINSSNKLVSVIVAILSALGVTVLHARQQVALKASK